MSEKNRVDPDQTAPEEQSDLGLHCLLFTGNISNIFENELAQI